MHTQGLLVAEDAGARGANGAISARPPRLPHRRRGRAGWLQRLLQIPSLVVWGAWRAVTGVSSQSVAPDSFKAKLSCVSTRPECCPSEWRSHRVSGSPTAYQHCN